MATPEITNPYEQIWKTRDLRALDAPLEIDSKLSSFERGLGRFGKQMTATGYALPALGAQLVEKVTGENEVTKGITDWGLEGYNKAIEESQTGIYKPKVAGIENIKTASDAMDWAGGVLGEQLPMVASLALTGGIGGAIARLGANAGVKALAGAAVGDIVKTGVQQGTLKAAAGQVITADMQKAAAKALMDTTIKGAAVGAYAGTAGLEGGLAFGEQVSQGVKPADAVASSIAVGGINGALELVTPYVVAKNMGLGAYAKNSIRKIITESPDLSKKAIALAAAKELGTRVAKGGAEGMITEGLTEGLQELTSIAGERWAKNDPLFAELKDEDWSRIKNSAAAGAFVGGALSGAGATLSGPAGQQKTPTEGKPGITPPVGEAKVQVLEGMVGKLDAAIAAATAAGDTAKVGELQQAKVLLGNALVQEAKKAQGTTAPETSIVPPAETPVVEPPIQTIPPAQEVVPPVQETSLDLPPLAQEPTIRQEPPIPPTVVPPGGTVQLKQGEEVILTPPKPGESKINVVPTQEEVDKLKSLMGEKPAKLTQETLPTVNFDEQGIFEHTFSENEIPTVAVSGRYDSDQKDLYIKRIDKNPNLNEKKGLGIEALQKLIADAEAQGKSIDTVTTEASESFIKSLERSIFADNLTVTDIPGLKEKDVVIDLTQGKEPNQSPAKVLPASELTSSVQESSPISAASLAQSLTDIGPIKNSLIEQELRADYNKGKSDEELANSAALNRSPSRQPVTGITAAHVAKVRAELGMSPNSGNTVLPAADSKDIRYSMPEQFTANREAARPTFYSALERTTQETKQEKAPAYQWLGTLDMLIKKGVIKQEELDWTGTADWLKEQKGVVTKEKVLQHVRDNTVDVQETEFKNYTKEDLENDPNYVIESYDTFGRTKWLVRSANSTEAYDDALVVANDRDDVIRRAVNFLNNDNGTRNTNWTEPGGKNQRELVLSVPSIEPFNTGDTTHYGDVAGGRAVAWVRFNDRVNEDGKKTLFIEEVQSKRHAEGRNKGYADYASLTKLREELNDAKKILKNNELEEKNGWINLTSSKDRGLSENEIAMLYKKYEQSQANIIAQDNKVFDLRVKIEETESKLAGKIPDAPFKQTIAGSGQTLSGWAGLVFKRMLKYAVENGYDSVAWTNGKQQAERYNLGQKVSRIDYDVVSEHIKVLGRDGTVVFEDNISKEKLPEYLGNDLTRQLFKEESKRLYKGVFSGGYRLDFPEGVVIGGEKLKKLYDSILPTEISKYVKKWGAKVEKTEIEFGDKTETVHSVEITPAMRESVMQGQPLFSFAGERAATADLMSLDYAKRYENSLDPEVVRQTTGWHRGVDGKWRFEISDKDMKWKKSFDDIPESKLFGEEKVVPLSEVIDHPRLFAAYPFLESVGVIKRAGFMDFGGLQGWMDDAKLQIGVTPYAKDPLSTILHEIQHVIQLYEGFAKGGNENSVWNALPNETKEQIAKDVLEKLNKRAAESNTARNILNELLAHDDLIKKFVELESLQSNNWNNFQKYKKANPTATRKDTEYNSVASTWNDSYNAVLAYKDSIAKAIGFDKLNTSIVLNRLQQIYTSANIEAELKNYNDYLNKSVADAISEIAKVQSGDEATIRKGADLYEFYKKLAGETEARLTQARKDMTEEERQQRSPQSMQEYPNEDLIVVNQGAGSASSARQNSLIRTVSREELHRIIDLVMGSRWLRQAEAAGIVEVIDGPGPRGESGSWAGDKFRLYTQTMPANGSPLGVLLHEGGHAPTFKEILGDAYDSYVGDLQKLADNGNKAAQRAISHATIATANVLGIKHNLTTGGTKEDLKNIQALIEERRPGLLAEEKLNYFIQYGTETQSGVGFLKRLINVIKAWFAQTKLGQALKQAGIGFEINEVMAVEWAKTSLRNSLTEAQKATKIREQVIAEAKQMPPSARLGRTLEAATADPNYSMSIQEFKDTLWTDPTDSRQEFINKPGLLQKFRANFIDFFAEMEKKSARVYDAYSLLRNKKAARLVQARQEYMLPLRDLVTNGPWTAKEVGDMLAARHLKVDKVNTKLAEDASYMYTKQLLKDLSASKRKELMKARSNVKAGKMPDGTTYIDANGNPATMTGATKQKFMFDLMNEYSQFEIRNSEGQQALRLEWEMFKDAAGGFSNGGVAAGKVRVIDDILAGTSKDQARFDRIANLFDAMNRHALQIREDGGLITISEHARLLLDKAAYAPLRRESYNVDREIEQLFWRAGQGGSKQLGTRTGTAALSEPTNVLQNALAALEASAAAAERNLANQELYEVVNGDRAAWKPWFSIVSEDKYMTHDEDGFLQEKNATASNRADITLIHRGKKLVIRPNMHNERAMGFVRAVNSLDAQAISGPMGVLNWFNGIVRWTNVTASPVFLMMNAIKDPFTAAYNLQASEAAPYTKEIFENYAKAFKALKKVFLDGNRDPNDPDVQMVEAFENAGGRTSFIEELKPSDDTWKSFDAQVARRQGNLKQVMAFKDKWLDGLENFNTLFENVMRLSTFNVLTAKGIAKNRAARIAQDLTTNFTRRGYKTQALSLWWVFFNSAVQGNYQVLRNILSSKRLQVLAGGTIAFALMLDLLGRALADDWDEIPEWDKERFIVLPIKVGGDFIKIPAPWAYNVLWRMGGMLGETLAGRRKAQDSVLDIAAMVVTTFNPLGKPGSIAQAIAPTAADPFVQILENKDFSGNPIGPEGFPGAGSKANSELLWSSTPKGYQSVARFVNEITGGSAIESGAIDFRPGDYQILVRFLTGSLGRFMADATFGLKENIEKGIEGPKDLPVIREFVSDPYNPMRSQVYHTNIAAIYGAHKLENMYREGPERDLVKLHEVRQERRKDLMMYSQANDVEKQIKSLRVRIRTAENRNEAARVKELRRRVEKVQEKFNESYKWRQD